MQKLMLQVITVAAESVETFISIFPVPHKRMTLRRQMGPDLMGTSGDQPDLQKRCPSAAAKGSVHGFYGQRALPFAFIYRYFITFCVFMQISFDMLFMLQNSLSQGQIILVDASVPEKL